VVVEEEQVDLMFHQMVDMEPLVVLVVAVVVMALLLGIMINQAVHLLLLQQQIQTITHLMHLVLLVVLVAKTAAAVAAAVELANLVPMALLVMVFLERDLTTFHIHLLNQQFLVHFDQQLDLK
tara:strand:+ start:317 stop:685 length:369 start_codon:yes stop_codon:yes gene_type:complete